MRKIIIVANYSDINNVDNLLAGCEFTKIESPKKTTYQVIGDFEVHNEKLNSREKIQKSLDKYLIKADGFVFQYFNNGKIVEK